MDRKPSILVIEDELVIRTAVVDALSVNGYEVGAEEDGDGGLMAAREGDHDLIVLDLMLPGIDGIEICERLRAEGNRTPILMLTAKGSEEDKVRGLSVGADDYLTKPFGLRELLARISALLRRLEWDDAPPPRLRCNGIEVDLERCEIYKEGEDVIEITKRESDILTHLARHRDRVVSKREFLLEVWGYPDVPIETRTVENTIVYFRQKLEPDPKNPVFIHTVRGEGFKLGRDVEWVEVEAT